MHKVTDHLDSLMNQWNHGSPDLRAERELIEAGYLEVIVSAQGIIRLNELAARSREKQAPKLG